MCHSDAGSQYTSLAYTERLAEIGAAPSIGTVGDSYDNALAETTIGLFKTELHRNPAALAANHGPWRGLDDLKPPPAPRPPGSTPSASTANSATAPPPRSKTATVKTLSPPRPEKSKPASLHQIQAGSRSTRSRCTRPQSGVQRMPQIDLASWRSPSRAVCPSGAQQQGLSTATAVGGFAMTRPTTCSHAKRFWSTKTRRSSMTATSKPFRFPPTSTPIHRATSESMPQPSTRALGERGGSSRSEDRHGHGHSFTGECSGGEAPVPVSVSHKICG